MLPQQNNFHSHLLFKLIVFSSVVLFAINFLIRLYIIPFHAIEIGGIEINVIDGIIKILAGKFLYTDPASPPYDIIQYSPLYYYLVAGISRLAGVSASDPQSVYMVTRYVALASNLSTLVIVFQIARLFRVSKADALLAGIFSFIILTQHYYSRGDSLYCFLFFLSQFFFLKFIEAGKAAVHQGLPAGKRIFFPEGVVTNLTLFSTASFLCIFTKQSGIIVLLTSGLFLLLKKDFKSVGIICIFFLLWSLLFLMISGSIGGLDAFYRNVVLGVKNGASLDMIKSFFNDKYFRQSLIWVVLGFFFSLGIFRKQKDPAHYFILLLLFSSLLFAFITGLKIGSSLNYFMECFILTILAGFIYFRNHEYKFFRTAFYVVFVLSISVKTGELFSATFISKFRNDDVVNYETEKRLSDFMLNEERLGDTDYVYLDLRGYTELFLQGKSILNQKDFNYMVYVYAFPEIDFRPLLEKADRGHIKYIISKQSLEEVYILGRHLRNFAPVKTFGEITVYKFKSPDS